MKKNLTAGAITPLIISLALPIIGSSFLQMAYGLVDMIWIGKLGSESLAGVGTAGFIINLAFAFNTLIITGAGIKVAHSIGEKKEEDALEYIKTGISGNIIISILLFTIFTVFSGSILGYFNLSEVVESYAKSYLFIIAFGFIFKFNNFLYARVLNSYGESKLPFKINLVGVGLNIILDPIFIFVLGLGIKGAAIATVICEVLTLLIFIKYSRKYFILKNYFSLKLKYIKNVFALGYPLALQRILFTGFAIIIGKMVAEWGTAGIAGQKVAGQIEAISFMTIGGVHGAVTSFMGQNFGAKKYLRLREGYTTSMKFAFVVGLLTTLLFCFSPEILSRIFTQDMDTIDVSNNYLRIVGLSQIFMCFEIVSNGVFNGIGKPKTPSIISVIFTSIRIPMAYYLITYFGLNGVWMSLTISSIIKGTLSPILCWRSIKKLEKGEI